MFLPTPSVIVARSLVKTEGSSRTASTPFFSQVKRNGKVSCPEKEGLIFSGGDFEFCVIGALPAKKGVFVVAIRSDFGCATSSYYAKI